MNKRIIEKLKRQKRNITVVDLFCGVGGLTHGFVKEKLTVSAGIDFDESCRFAFEANNKTAFIQADLTKYPAEEIKKLFPKKGLKILVGCAPCQAFSTYTQGDKTNVKWKLLYAFGKIISIVKPDVVSMENVPNLLKYRNGIVFCDFLSVLYANNYSVDFKIVDAKDYGVPQRRTRLILIASKIGTIKLLNKTHPKGKLKTVRKAIGKLPKIEHGETDANDPLHRARQLSSLNLRRIKATPEGGSWKNWKNKDLILDCHKKASGKTYGSVYGRMRWKNVAPTLTTQCTGYGNGRYGHPRQNRAISLREAAILQSFPKNYKFIDPKVDFNSSLIEQHIGNAVPVRLGRIIARSIKKHIEKNGKKDS
jgi:DNA (cytosine-5)-methyltransferase 1